MEPTNNHPIDFRSCSHRLRYCQDWASCSAGYTIPPSDGGVTPFAYVPPPGPSRDRACCVWASICSDPSGGTWGVIARGTYFWGRPSKARERYAAVNGPKLLLWPGIYGVRAQASKQPNWRYLDSCAALEEFIGEVVLD